MQKVYQILLRSFLVIVVSLLSSNFLFAQAPQLLNYQGVARNAVGNAIPNKTMTLRVTIRNGSVTGASVYSETRQIRTNGAGLFATQIGSAGATSVSGSMAGISWSNGSKFLQVELDPEGGNAFIDMGTNQLVSVPYALNADNATNVTGIITIANGGTGASTASSARTNLGLGNVDNTSDLNKPVSTATQTALNIKEDVSNKSTNPALGNSDVLYPSQKAVKVYVDQQVLSATPDASTTAKGKIQLAGDFTGTSDLPRIAANAVTTSKIADGNVTDAKISSVSGSKISGNITGNAANVTGVVAIENGGTGATTVSAARIALNLENIDNTSDASKPVSTATQTALNAKEDLSNKSTNVALGNSDVLYPTQKAVKTYVDQQVTASTPDASATVKGKIQLAGDLTNSAAEPRIANNAVTSIKIADFNVTTTKLADASVTDVKIAAINGSKVSGNISGNAANVTGTIAIANGGTGATTIVGAKSALGLENVNNTSDLNKPVSTATQTALDAKENKSNKSADGSLGTSDDLYPTQNAVKVYVDTKTASLISSVGSISATASANGATLTSGVLNLTPADESNGGVVTTSAQIFSGAKTFSSDIIVNGVKIGRGTGNNDQNVAVGADALASGTGTRNTAVGYGAMRQYSGTSFDNNTSLGYWNMSSLTTGNGNTSIGAEAMLNITTGTQNTSVGNQSLINTTGDDNVGIGKRSGDANTTGSQNTFIGTNTTAGSNNLNNATAIGYGASVAASNSIQLGNTNVTTVNTSGTITANGFVKSGGTSSQFLMADGSTTSSPSLSGATGLPLTTGVAGTLPVANGGTGATSLTGLVKGNGTGAMTAAVAGTDYLQAVAPGSSGNVLTSNGTTWVSNKSGSNAIICKIVDAQATILSIGGYEFRYNSSTVGGFIEVRSSSSSDNMMVFCQKNTGSWNLNGTTSTQNYRNNTFVNSSWRPLIELATGYTWDDRVTLSTYDSFEATLFSMGNGPEIPNPLKTYKIFAAIDGYNQVFLKAEYTIN